MNINIEISSFQDLPAPIFIFFVILSVAMIVAGRKLLWLYLGGITFLVLYAALLASGISSLNETTIVLIAIGSGVVVSAIMYFLHPVALVIAALTLGINVATQFVSLLNVGGDSVNLVQGIVTLAIGLACVVASFRYRDDALIVLSVLTGTGFVTQELLHLDTNAALTAVFWLSLCLLGVIVQYAFLQREHRARQAGLVAVPSANASRTAA